MKKTSWKFLRDILVIFILTFLILYIFRLMPKSMLGNLDFIFGIDEQIEVDNKEKIIDVEGSLTPTKISIPSIGIDTQIFSPESQDVAVLDSYLKRGAVYYPGSGTFKGGNMLIFGHSAQGILSSFYKTFNGIEKLKEGDLIKIESEDSIYEYKVESITLYNEEEALIKFANKDQYVTLSTCNSFGAKQERWVVEAKLSKSLKK
jgi:LPXTG-site transpeptidase (sortase) family protein